jgi:UMF1 family MFS transporter
MTTVATVLFGPYLTSLAQAEVGENGPVFAWGALHALTTKGFFFYCLSGSVLLQVVLLPYLGAVADSAGLKKRLLVAFAGVGALATCLLFFVGGGVGFRWGGLLFAVANLCCGASVVLSNAFLPAIAPEAERDAVSSRGFAMGYLGGGLLLVANLAFIRFGAPALGISTGLAVRLSFLSAGLWWGLFSIPLCRSIGGSAPGSPSREGPAGFAKLVATLGRLRDRPQTRRYLVAYLLYNDGIQTVISVAAVFIAQELFVRTNRPGAESFLIGVMVMVQFVGVVGALAFERIASRVSAKTALLGSLVGWSAVVLYGYALMETPRDAFGMSLAIALVLGGSQALSRSLFSRMIPKGDEACFFAIYEISESGTSWLGPLVFAVVVAVTNSYRNALVSLLGLLVAGTLILAGTDVEAAFAEATRPEPAVPPRPRRPPAGPPIAERLLDGLRRGVVRVALQVFFREVRVSGEARIPEGTPLVLAANHNNSVVDAFLLMGLGRTNPRMLAKSPLFAHPLMGPLLRFARALPVYRRQDPGAHVAQNLVTFSRCRGILARGGAIALFPEGTSHSEAGLRPLRTGAARLALEAEDLAGPLGIEVVPVALRYDDKQTFRSRAWVHVGQPIPAAAFRELYREQGAEAVRALTRRLAAGLQEATEETDAAHRPADTPSPGGAILCRLGAPLLALGCLLNWVPYRLPGYISERLSKTADEPATYKLLTGLVAFPLAWVAETLLAGLVAGPMAGVALAVVAPASGYLALRIRECRGEGRA